MTTNNIELQSEYSDKQYKEDNPLDLSEQEWSEVGNIHIEKEWIEYLEMMYKTEEVLPLTLPTLTKRAATPIIVHSALHSNHLHNQC